ncbi:MAG: 50S ribosomal protein L22 [Planctomycetes bacterium]|nr:50S ribosomal protein L22 [Planctomycetota bacterium]
MTAVFRASHRYARIAARKAQPIMNMIRGLSAGSALDTLANDNHRASSMIHKVVASAVANAMQDPAVRANRLVVERAFVQEGPLLFGRMRFRPASMGRATPIRRRTCHLHVQLVDPGEVRVSASDRVDAEPASSES